MSQFRKDILISWGVFLGFSVSGGLGVYLGTLISSDAVLPFITMCISMGVFASVLAFIKDE